MERKASTISVDTYCLRFVASLVLSFPITSDGGKVYLLSSKIIEKAKSTKVRLFSCRRFPQNIYPRADMCLPFSALKIFLLHKPPTREIYMSITRDVKITINSYCMYYVYFLSYESKSPPKKFLRKKFLLI